MIRRLILFCVVLAFGLTSGMMLAQQPSRTVLVGILVPSIGPSDPLIDALRDELRQLGYVEGQNLRIEFRSAQGKLDRLPGLAQELVSQKVDVLVAGAEPAILAAKQATQTIPIVMVGYVYDPVASGLVDSLAHPGGNVTGVFTRTSELVGKRLELLKELVPRLTHVAVLWDSFSTREREEVEPAARTLGVQVTQFELQAPYDFRKAFKAAKNSKAGAVLLLFSPEFYVARTQIAASALAVRLPTVAGNSEYTQAGVLASDGSEGVGAYRRVAYFVDKILQGAKSSDLPVEQSTTFKLVINLKSAKALGITIPESILLRADEVIR